MLAFSLLAILYLARDFLVPITGSFILALTFSPLVRALSRLGIPAALSAVLIVASLLMATLSLIYLLAFPVSDWFNRVPEIGAALKEKASILLAPLQVVMEAQREMDEVTTAVASDVQAVTIQGPGLFETAASNMFSMATTLAITLVLLTFLLGSGDLFYSKLVHRFESLEDKKQALGTARNVERVISRYLLTITTINVCLGVAIGLAMHAWGMPTPYVWGAMATLLNFMPYIGAVIGLGVVVAVSAVTFETLPVVVGVAATYFAFTTIEGQFVTPLTVGRKLELNAVSVFIAVGFWAWLWGFVGALIAVPILVIVKTVCENIDSTAHIANFLSNEQRKTHAA
ncbi:AI-2E family transporter [Pseudahrensia aquimaris]|uniref:AI-2E family transporter n=2 Tax=Pseudahrensia aquimaris TaxID=744461 RepID=A0ABW3FDG7_9HYPH